MEQIFERFAENPNVLPENNRMDRMSAMAGPETYQGQGLLNSSIIYSWRLTVGIWRYHSFTPILPYSHTLLSYLSLQQGPGFLQGVNIPKRIFRNQEKRPAVEIKMKEIRSF